MNERVFGLRFAVRRSVVPLFTLAIAIRLATCVFADEGQQASPPPSPPAPTAEKPVVTMPPVMAPAPQPAPPQQKEVASAAGVQKLTPVVVTGSLIPTAETVGPTPVDVYTPEAIDKTGATDPRAFLREIPATSGAANFSGSDANGGDGSAGVNLRGISNGTLVLINGRRVAQNGLSTGHIGNVDINAIPLSAIDRIEVLKDGASAIYGADAVAGVVNIILKKDYNGMDFSGRYGDTTSGGSDEETFSFVMGKASDKSSLLIGGSYYKVDKLPSNDRDVSRINLNNPNDSAFGTSPTFNPGQIGALHANDGQSGFPPSGSTYTGAKGTTPTSTSQFRVDNPSTDRAVFSDFTFEVAPQERWFIFGNGSYNILDDNRLQFFSEASYAHTTRDNQFAPAPLTSGLAGPIPAANPYNVFGVDITKWRYRFFENGPREDHNVADVFRFVGGFRGDIPDSSWNWETGFLYSEDDRFERFSGDVSARALLAAAASTDPATAFNIFGNQANSKAVVNALALQETARAVSTLPEWDGLARGDLFDLPAGAVKLAVGGQMHDETLNYQPDAAYQGGDSATGNSATPIVGSRHVKAAYAEVSIPFIGKSMALPMFHSLEVTAAGRYDNYSDFGDTENPKVTVRWQPLENESVTLRASYGTSFQAPALGDLSGSVLSFFGVDVPKKSPDGKVTYGNSGPIDQLDQGGSLVGNPNLKPQTSENWTGGIVITPPQLKRLTLSVDYYSIVVKNLVIQDPQFVINNFNPGQIDPLTKKPYITLDSANNVVSLDVPFLNLGALDTDGFDFGATYEIPADPIGKFTLSGDANLVLTWKEQTEPGTPFVNHLGQDDTAQLFGAIPRLKSNCGLVWDYKGFSFGTFAHYIGRYIDEAINKRVPDEWTIDMQVSYLIRKTNTKLTVGCLDVTDVAPPKDYAPGATNGNLYSRNLYDIRQQFFYVSFDQKF